MLRFSYWCLAIALFGVAIVAPSTFFPFIGVKAYWFRLWVSAAAIAFLWWYGFTAPRKEANERFKRLFASPLVWAVTAFVGAFLISTFLARDPALAFWSNFERGEGGFAMLYLYALFLLLGLVIPRTGSTALPPSGARRERAWFGSAHHKWRGMMLVSVIAALMVVGYGVLAMLDNPENGTYFMGPTSADIVAFSKHFAGSLGNSIYVGSYLLFVFFYLGILLEDKQRGQNADRTRKYAEMGLYFTLAALFFVFFVLSQGRGAMVGLVAGILAGLGFAVSAARGRTRYLLLGILGALLVFGAALRYYKDSPAVASVPIVSRFARISVSSDLTRLYAWWTAWEAFKERPLFGWGPENFTEEFDRRFDTRHFMPGVDSTTWYDRAHSIIFDYLAELGAVGLAGFLSIFAAFYWQFFKFWDRTRVLWGALWFAFPVAYLAQGVTIFDIFPIYIQLFLFLGYAAYEFSGKREAVTSKQ
ncbi:MAG: O-antigen ligase family protein [bacterium]|nr:O-antigen ligase family protein [bacterium]